MHIETRGSGPALVLIHGWAMHAGLFSPLLDHLKDHFTLYLVDLPGHGYSADSNLALTPEAVVAYLSDAVPRAVWLGWSMGGLMALHAAASRPTHVRGLVMLAATPRFVRAHDWPAGMDPAIFRTFARDLETDYRGTLDRFLMLEAHGSDHLREDLQLLREQVFARGRPDTHTLQAGLALLEGCDLRSVLPTLSVPSLWLAGHRDRLVSPEAMRTAAGMTPHAHSEQIAGGGHSPFLTHADRVATALRSFVSDLPT